MISCLPDKKSIDVVDLHCDTAYELLRRGFDLDNDKLHITLSKMKAYRHYAQVFAAWTDNKLKGGARFDAAVRIIENFRAQCEKYSGDICLCTRYDDIISAWESGRIAALLGIEGAGAFDGSLDNIDTLYDLGVRIVTVTWNGANELACGVPDEGGLTDFGRRALERMEKLGIIADISHANAESAADILSCYNGPVVASHSNMRAVCGHARNLDCGQLAALAARGGLVGLNLCPTFVKSADRVGKSDVIPHISAEVSAGAAGSLCLGCDFDGVTSLPEGIAGAEDLDALYALIRDAGYAADAIFSENALEFLKKNLY